MDQDLPDDFFVDDLDLDDLPVNTLAELEETALRSTQASHHHLPQPRSHHRPPSPASEFGLEDDDVIDLDAQQPYVNAQLTRAPSKPVDEVTQREQWRQRRYGGSSKNLPHSKPNSTVSNGHVNRPTASQSQWQEPSQSNIVAEERGPQNAGVDVSALQQRIAELEQEHTALQKSTEEAKSAAFAKAGEIAIVRANQDKVTKDYERRLAALQQQHNQEVGKQKAELEATRRDREKIETNNRFLEHDLAQEAERARNIKRTLTTAQGNNGRTRPQVGSSPLATPKKDRDLPFRDGFNDDEVVFVSPSKARSTSRPSTPRVGSKRKRGQTLEPSPSPGQRLRFAEPDVPRDAEPAPPVLEPEIVPMKTTSEEKFQLLQKILNHCGKADRARTFEALNGCAFPSQPNASISSILFGKFALLPPKQDVNEFQRNVCDMLITLWSQCLAEKFYTPLYDLTELLQYILILSPTSLSTSLISRVVPLCLATADLVALPTAKASKSPSQEIGPSPELLRNIDPLDYLAILDLLTLNCLMDHKENLSTFWTHMEFDFVLLILHKSQPQPQIHAMLQLLRTSILPDSFAAITDRPPAQQAKHESDIVDRLTILLFEIPQKPQPRPSPPLAKYSTTPQPAPQPQIPPYTLLELSTLRNSVLTLLASLALSSHGGPLLSTHRLFIGRLIRFLHESVLQLYTYSLPTHSQTSNFINTSVHILSHLTTTYPNLLDLRVKLAAVPGGSQKFLLALSRVAFAEGESVIEEDIEAEAAEEAHRLLDEMLSPEEGEAVVEVFTSAGR